MIDNMPGTLTVIAYTAVYALAILRLTGLIALDEISRPVREAIVDRLDVRRGWHRKMIYLAGGYDDDRRGCPWCISVWVSAAVVPAAWWWHDRPWLLLPALVLAASQTAGMLSGVGRG